MKSDDIMKHLKSKDLWIRAILFFAIIGFIMVQTYQRGQYDMLREVCPLGNDIYRSNLDGGYYCVPPDITVNTGFGGEREIQLYRIGS